MGAYNFQKRYVEPIRSGVKRGTIRQRRKNGYLPRPGEILALYWGMRTKKCELIRKVAVESVEPVAMDIEHDENGRYTLGVAIRGVPLSVSQLHQLAIEEGFKHADDMAEFFLEKYGVALSGWLIRWNPAVTVA